MAGVGVLAIAFIIGSYKKGDTLIVSPSCFLVNFVLSNNLALLNYSASSATKSSNTMSCGKSPSMLPSTAIAV